MKVKPKEPRISGNESVQKERRVKGAHLKYDDDGRELMDPTPIAPPIGYKKSPTIAEQIRTMIRSEKLRQEAEEAGYESFEEADDFDVGDDFDPKSPYEEVFEPMPVDDGTERLKTLGDHIGDRIYSKLGGEQPLPPEGDFAEKPPAASRQRAAEPPASNPSPAPGGSDMTAGERLARGSLKPRAT